MTPETGQNHQADDEYRKATKEVVDDMFRDDVLGPRMCSVLGNHTPVTTKIIEIIASSISKEPTIKTALEGVINEIDAKRKGRWVDRGLGAIVAIIVGIMIWGIPYIITQNSSPAAAVK